MSGSSVEFEGTRFKVIDNGDGTYSLNVFSSGGSPSMPSAVTVVSANGTGDYNATGVNDQVPIQSAINAVSGLGGGIVFIRAGTYNLSASIVPISNVSIYGVLPGLTNFDGISDDWWTFSNQGTVLKGDGTFPGFAYNNVPSSNPSAYTSVNALQSVEICNLGLYNFSRGFDIGSSENPGSYFCVFRSIFVSSCTDWGIHFENFSECLFERIFSVSSITGDMWFAGSASLYNSGNTTFIQLYASPLNNLARGIVFAAPGGHSNAQSVLNSIKVFDIQANRYRDTLVTQTITPSNGSTPISVTDLTKFKVGMPFWVTSTADGYSANVMYFVLSVSGSTGAGTITAGTSASTNTAISGTGNTPLTLKTAGFANVELAGNISTVGLVSTVNAELHGLDLEGEPSSMLIYDEGSNESSYQPGFLAQTGGPAAFVLRSARYPQITFNYPIEADIDGNSNNVTWNGARGTLRQFCPIGLYFDSALNTNALNLYDGNSQTPTAYMRGNAKHFLYPSRGGFGELIATQDTSVTLSDTMCGLVTFNGSSSQTITLPVIDNASTPSNSFQGFRVKIVNASGNSLSIATQNSQTFNNVTNKTTTTMAPNSVLELTAATTAGGTLYWAAMYIPATALP